MNEQKLRYLEELGESYSGYKNIKRLFEKAEYFEDSTKKDLSEWSVAEIVGFLTFMGSRSIATLRTFRSLMVSYTQWCLQNSLSTTGQNNWQIVTQDILQRCVNNQREDYISRRDILNICDRALNPGDAFIVLGIYEGINAYGNEWEEIVNAKYSDIDTTAKTISLCTGRVIPISEDLIRYAYKGSVATEIYASDDKSTPVSPVEPHDLIVKTRMRKNPTNDSFIAGIRCYKRFDNIVSRAGYTISANTIKEYGRLNFIEDCSKKDGLSVEEWLAVKENEELVEKIFGSFYKASWLRTYVK